MLLFDRMTTFLILLGCLYSLGAIVMFVAAGNAPEGYEDETGFHRVWRNNDPERADVACVWEMTTAPAA